LAKERECVSWIETYFVLEEPLVVLTSPFAISCVDNLHPITFTRSNSSTFLLMIVFSF